MALFLEKFAALACAMRILAVSSDCNWRARDCSVGFAGRGAGMPVSSMPPPSVASLDVLLPEAGRRCGAPTIAVWTIDMCSMLRPWLDDSAARARIRIRKASRGSPDPFHGPDPHPWDGGLDASSPTMPMCSATLTLGEQRPATGTTVQQSTLQRHTTYVSHMHPKCIIGCAHIISSSVRVRVIAYMYNRITTQCGIRTHDPPPTRTIHPTTLSTGCMHSNLRHAGWPPRYLEGNDVYQSSSKARGCCSRTRHHNEVTYTSSLLWWWEVWLKNTPALCVRRKGYI